jgi:hypothetical protein
MQMPQTTKFLNYDLMARFELYRFPTTGPFPWFNFSQFLTQEGFEELHSDFPSVELFEQHSGIARPYGQRPHNRYYLAYEESIYHNKAPADQGVVAHGRLPRTWQLFIEELRQSREYRQFIKTALGVADFKARYAWHIGFSGSEVSPHVDSRDKIGTHIFYFNTSGDWKPEWGGTTLVLGDKKTAARNPDFTDFETAISAEIRDNRSFLFKNTGNAWHGAEALTCPPGRHRRLFNVIFIVPSVWRALSQHPLVARFTDGLRSSHLLPRRNR